jgi:signal recognition particle subunit SRP68
MKLNQFPQPNSIDMANLVEYPPKLQPIPVKPFFFDIAYNYIGTDDSLRAPGQPAPVEEKKPEPVKRGWFWR